MDVQQPVIQAVHTGPAAKPDKLMTLARLNPHPKDKNITFEEVSHTYTIHDPENGINNVLFSSVTTWNDCHFEKFDPDLAIRKMRNGRNWGPSNKYYGMSDAEIKKTWDNTKDVACSSGTNLHAAIEDFMNNQTLQYPYYHGHLYNEFFERYAREGAALLQSNPTYTTKEWGFFLNYLKDLPGMKPYRTEWAVYHQKAKIAGMIDMLYENPDGTYIIADWKRTVQLDRNHKNERYPKFATTGCIKHFIDSNYWHYVLQLNIYRYILYHEYGKTVSRMFLIILHSNNKGGNYEMAEVPACDKEMHDLFNLRISQLAAGLDVIAQHNQKDAMSKMVSAQKEASRGLKPETATGDELLMKMMGSMSFTNK